MIRRLAVGLAVALAAPLANAAVDAPEAFDVADRSELTSFHAVGTQIYVCKGGQWTFQEPAATLSQGGKNVGRHFAGPSWQVGDSIVTAKLDQSAPGGSVKDVPLLKLDVATRKGSGAIDQATIVLRLHTVGGVFKGTCETEGATHAEPYQADYVFLK